MAELPEWMHPPREEGWLAEDLDNLPDAPRHTELIDGALVFTMSPQRRWHNSAIFNLRSILMEQAPDGYFVDGEMTIRLNDRNRPEPDVLVSVQEIPWDASWYEAADVRLAVEVVSPESEHRDTAVKPHKYAEAGIPNFWRVDYESRDGRPVTAVHVYELDETTHTYVPTGVFRDVLELSRPFPVEFAVQALYSTGK